MVQNMPLYAVFSDFSKAFHTVPRKSLWKVLGEYGCPANGKGSAQRNASTCGRRKLHLQEIGGQKNGAKPGCVFAPTLFCQKEVGATPLCDMLDILSNLA